MKTLADAFHHTLKDIYYAEKAIVKAGPKLAKAATDADLKAAIEAHVEETRQQIEMLEGVFRTIGEKPEGEKCDAIVGLIKEAEGIVEEAEGVALNAALLGALQAIEHYEIARYGTLRQWAEVMGEPIARDQLTRILDMEKAANAAMTGLAVKQINAA
ncbi:ferritin-like domain-containing protein [Paracoccus sp. p4-l81]|uniref:YciE/YciF ferroxidase family protein n=1 Tax=unclassified Paracoccus (in: a-proteobacteria) TaxID=2688777 RepID=UPI0035B6C2CC